VNNQAQKKLSICEFVSITVELAWTLVKVFQMQDYENTTSGKKERKGKEKERKKEQKRKSYYKNKNKITGGH
jgi:hypothetical protein